MAVRRCRDPWWLPCAPLRRVRIVTSCSDAKRAAIQRRQDIAAGRGWNTRPQILDTDAAT
jgi:hypothetical protein